MLTPRHPSALDREAALALLEELQRPQDTDRRLDDLVKALRRLVVAAEATKDR